MLQPTIFCHIVHEADRIRLSAEERAHLAGTSTEQAVPQAQIDDVERDTGVHPATLSRAQAVWQKSNWHNARGVLLFTSCINLFISYTLNANLNVTSPAAVAVNISLRAQGCVASIGAMISTAVFGLEVAPLNLFKLESLRVRKQVELLQLSCQNRCQYGEGLGRYLSVGTVIWLATSQTVGYLTGSTGYNVLDFHTTGLGWQIMMAVTYYLQGVLTLNAFCIKAYDALGSEERLAAPLFDKLLRKLYLGPDHPVSKVYFALDL